MGVNACKTNSDNRTTNTTNAPVDSVNGVSPEAHAQQQQGQQQGQTATGGSVGGSRGGAPQRMVTTIRLQECVAYEIVPKQAELPKVKPQPKRKPVAPKPTPKVCDACQRPQVNLTVNVQK